MVGQLEQEVTLVLDYLMEFFSVTRFLQDNVDAFQDKFNHFVVFFIDLAFLDKIKDLLLE